MSRSAQRARMEAYSARELHDTAWGKLLDAALAERPTWRMGFDEHVRVRRAYLSRRCFELYQTIPAFAAEQDARVAELRAMPMPPIPPIRAGAPS